MSADITVLPYDVDGALKHCCERSFKLFVKTFWRAVPGGGDLVWNWHLDVICDELQRIAELVFAGKPKDHDLVLNVPPGTSKPVWDGSFVSMADGTWRVLRDVVVGDEVIGKSGRPCRVNAVHVQGQLPTVCIHTAGGRKLYAAHDHPVLTTEGWVNAGDITDSHVLALMHRPTCSPTTSRTDDEFALAGYLIGDGSLTHGNCSVTNKDPDYVADLLGCLGRLGFGHRLDDRDNGVKVISLKEDKSKSTKQRGLHKGRGRGYREPRGPRKWVRDVGLYGLSSKTKRVPDFVWKGTDEQVARFLATYFHCDGCVSYRDKGKRNIVVSACTISRGLAKDLQRLFLRLGVPMRFRCRVARNGYSYNRGLKNYRYYVVETSDQDSAARFLEKVPLIGKKRNKLEGFRPCRRTFEQTYWPDPVTSVEDGGERACRCLTVEGDASFVVDGLVVHNSTLASILFQPWTWTRMPSARHICGSHTSDLVLDLATKARSVINSEKYRQLWPHVVLTGDQDVKSYYRNTLGGDRYSCTVSGRSPIGFHAHFQSVDDALDPKEVLSEQKLKTAREFFTNHLPGRKVDRLITPTVLIMQRLGVGDPTDVMLEYAKREGAAPVRHVCLPAEETDDVNPPELRKHYVNGLLDPRRLSRQALERERAVMGEYAYATQFLQKASLPGGGLFKDHYFNRRVRAAPYECRRVRYWDRASSVGESACATAGTLMAIAPNNAVYIEDVVHGKWEPDERNEKMRATALRDRHRYGPRHEPVIYVEREGGSSGRDAWLGVVRALAGFVVREDTVTGSKDVRAEPLATQLSAGNVWLVDGGESEGTGHSTWDIAGFVDEFVKFRPTPGGKLGRRKDRVDSCSGAFNVLVNRRQASAPRVYNLGQARKGQVRILPVTAEELRNAAILEPTLLVSIQEPRFDETGNPADPEPPVHALQGLAGHLCVGFADLSPYEQGSNDQWDVKGLTGHSLADLALTPACAKRIWAFLLRKRDPAPSIVLIQGGEDGRHLSVAMAVCDALHQRREGTLLCLDGQDFAACKGDPPNRYVYEVMKDSRRLVIG